MNNLTADKELEETLNSYRISFVAKYKDVTLFLYTPYNRRLVKFARIVKKYLPLIIDNIEKEFGKIIPRRVHIIMDYFGISTAGIYGSQKIGVVRLNIVDRGGDKLVLRWNKRLLKILVHELCHLTEKGYYKGKRTPEEIHKKFDEIAEETLQQILDCQ